MTSKTVHLLLLLLYTKNVFEVLGDEITQKVIDISTGLGTLLHQNQNLTEKFSAMEKKIQTFTTLESALKLRQDFLEEKIIGIEKVNKLLLDALNQTDKRINQVNTANNLMQNKIESVQDMNNKLEGSQQINENQIKEINNKLLVLAEDKKREKSMRTKDIKDNLLHERQTNVTFEIVKNLTFNVKRIEKELMKLTEDQHQISHYMNKSFDGIRSDANNLSEQQRNTLRMIKQTEYLSKQMQKDIYATNQNQDNLSAFLNKTANILTTKLKTLSEKLENEVLNTKLNQNHLLKSLNKTELEIEAMKKTISLSGQLHKEVQSVKVNYNNLSILLHKTENKMSNLTSLSAEIQKKFQSHVDDINMMIQSKNVDDTRAKLNQQNISHRLTVKNPNKTIEEQNLDVKELKQNQKDLSGHVKNLMSSINILSQKIDHDVGEMKKSKNNLLEIFNNKTTKFTLNLKNLEKHISEEIHKIKSSQSNLTQLVNSTITTLKVDGDFKFEQIDKNLNEVKKSHNKLSGYLNNTRKAVILSLSFLSHKIDNIIKNNLSEHINNTIIKANSNINKIVQQIKGELHTLKLNQNRISELNQIVNQVKIAQTTLSEQINSDVINQNNLPEQLSKTAQTERSNNNVQLDELRKEVAELKLNQTNLSKQFNKSTTNMMSNLLKFDNHFDMFNKSLTKEKDSIEAITNRLHKNYSYAVETLLETNIEIKKLKEHFKKSLTELKEEISLKMSNNKNLLERKILGRNSYEAGTENLQNKYPDSLRVNIFNKNSTSVKQTNYKTENKNSLKLRK